MKKHRSVYPRFHFRLQTMFVLLSALAVALGLVFQELNHERHKKQSIAQIHHLRGRVDSNRNREESRVATGVINGWLRLFLGDAYFSKVRYVGFAPQAVADLDLLDPFLERILSR